MDNAAIADNFSLLSRLMDIHGENSFKTKTYSIAAFNIENLPAQLKDTPRENLPRLKGMGESVLSKVLEMLDTGQLSALNDYISRTPPGVIELLNIKGLGPKKIHTIWKEMEIESVGELLYACNENRLTLFKGFGAKTQQNVQESIEFYLQNQGSFLYAQIDEIYPQIEGYLKKMFPDKVWATGAYRRQEDTLDELEFVIAADNEKVKPVFQTAQPPELLEENAAYLFYKLKNGLKLKLYTGDAQPALSVLHTTGPAAFVSALSARYPAILQCEEKNEEQLFSTNNIPFIPPALRSEPTIASRAMNGDMPALLQPSDIKGIIHSHSNWSDGASTIEEMARECMRRGLEYLVISDHSKTAVYAKGLSEERIVAQHQYIDELNQQLYPFRIFKSIESDILTDGSLDYPDEILRTLDLVIASVHSNLKMPEHKAMERLTRAITNPYTTILGHMTGRLLLSRKGYPLDHEKIIELCAANQVVIEINAHPRRLDMDWSWIPLAMEKNVLLSIDPDAHYLEGFDDVKYGVLAAQKGGLTATANLSSFSRDQLEQFLLERKNQKGI